MAIRYLWLLPVCFLFGGVVGAQSIAEILVEPVDELPYPQACAEEVGEQARGECAMRELLTRVFDQVRYPGDAIREQIQGLVQVGFTISATGEMRDLQVVKDIGGGCGEAAVKAVRRAHEALSWIPARASGKQVDVHLVLPVQFRMAPPK